MKTIRGGGRRGRLATALLAVAAAVAIAACGSSASTGSGGAGSGGTANAAATTATGPASFTARRAKLRACLKQHGITLPARRPGGHGPGAPPAGAPRGRGLFGGGGFLRGNPKFQAAFKACGAEFPHRAAGRFGPHFAPTTLRAFVACVKRHGYSLPEPNTSGTGPVFPRSIASSAEFQAAARACAGILRPAFRGAPGASPPGTPTTATATTTSKT